MRKLYNFLSTYEKRKLRNRKKLNNRINKYLRISIYKSNRNFYVQLINDQEGVTITSASTLDNKIRGLCNGRVNTKTVEHVSYLMVERLSNIELKQKLVFDRGRYKYTGLISQFAESLRNAGFEF